MKNELDLTKVLKVGDKAWDMRFGWIDVANINFSTEFPIRCGTKGNSYYYTHDGKYLKDSIYPILFIEPPTEFVKAGIIKVPQPKKWKPCNEDRYWFVTENGSIDFSIARDTIYDKRMIEAGNCFRTAEEAKRSEFYKVFHEDE